MKAHLRHVTALLLVICCLLSVVGCQRGAGEEPYEAEKFIIGVAVYDPDSAEMAMFMNYYRDYIAEGFPVEFYFSDRLTSGEEEQDFIRSVKKQVRRRDLLLRQRYQAGAGNLQGGGNVLCACLRNLKRQRF